MEVFSGVMTAIATPFNVDGSLDSESFGKLVLLQREAGIHGIVVCGTTGENPTLTPAERDQLVKIALDFQTPQFKIYVGCGSNSTREAADNAIRYAAFKGAVGNVPDGLMAVTPYYNKPTQAGLEDYYTRIAKAVPHTPVCLYNVPGRTACQMSPCTMINIAKKNPNVVAIKEAAGDIRVITEIRKLLDANRLKVQLLSGDDPTFAPALLCGATGIISVSSHLIPKGMLEIFECFGQGDLRGMQKTFLQLDAINGALFCAPSPIPLKWAMARQGMCLNTVRSPLLPLDESLAILLESVLATSSVAGVSLAKGSVAIPGRVF